ncbi:uncharacterized protein PAF06_009549 [Gastrophryne carolinensis]
MSTQEMGKLNVSPDEDSTSINSNDDFNYPAYSVKKLSIKERYDRDLENQNFLLEPRMIKKKSENEYLPGTTSFGMSVFNLSNAIVGSGILGLSYAMANTGIALFMILLTFVSIFSLYSIHLLLKTANEGGSLLYEQLGFKAFGLFGKLAASGSITMQNVGAMSSYLYIVKYELPLVIRQLTGADHNAMEWYLNGDYLVVMVSFFLILPLSLLRNLGYLGYTSGLSLMCMVFFLCVVIYKKFEISCPLLLENDAINMTLNYTLTHLSTHAPIQSAEFNHTDDEMCKPKYFVFNSQTVYAVPILTFSFVCHPAVLPIYQELKGRSRKRMMNVSNVSFCAMFFMYLLAALFGYLTFYGNVEPELLHTYSKVPGAGVIFVVVRLAVLIAVTLTVPIVIFPIRSSITQLLCSGRDFAWWRHIVITLLILAFTNFLVIFVPTIRDIFGFIGASAAAMLVFILPSAFYIKLVAKESMKSVQKIGALMFLLSGFVVMIGSMTLIIIDWTHSASHDQHATQDIKPNGTTKVVIKQFIMLLRVFSTHGTKFQVTVISTAAKASYKFAQKAISEGCEDDVANNSGVDVGKVFLRFNETLYTAEHTPRKLHIKQELATGKLAFKMPFKNGLELTELQNMNTPEDDNISNDSNELIEADGNRISSKFIADRESRRSLTNSHLEKKKSCDDYSPGATSVGMSVFNLSNAIMGSGILGLAFALANTGILLFVLLLISVALLSIYSINLLLKCSQETGCMVYEKLGEQVFGTPGRLLVFGSTSLQNIGAMLTYLFIVKNELPNVIKFMLGINEDMEQWYLDGRFLVVIVTIGIILPLCLLKNLGYLGYTSGFSLTCMFFFLVVVVYNKFRIPCPYESVNGTSDGRPNKTVEELCSPKYLTYNSKTAYALPTLAFAFVCHPSVLPIYSELRDRSQKKMQLVAHISFFAMFVMYLLTAVFGYLTFYDKVHSELLSTYQNRNDILILTVRLAVITAVILTVPVLFFTVRSSLFELARKTKYIFWQHLTVTILLLIVIDLLVIFIPSMEDIFGVIGATSANMLIFLLPASLYLKITKGNDELEKERLCAFAFFALGFLFSLVSIPLVIYDWAYGSSTDDGH